MELSTDYQKFGLKIKHRLSTDYQKSENSQLVTFLLRCLYTILSVSISVSAHFAYQNVRIHLKKMSNQGNNCQLNPG